MKIQTLLGLCLSGSLLFAGSAALADNDKEKSNNRSARAVQVHIDKEGRKTVPADSDDAVTTSVATAAAVQPISAVDASVIMPAEHQTPVQHADGSVSARLGVKSMKFMTLTIGEDGEKSVTHETLEELENRSEVESADKGLE